MASEINTHNLWSNSNEKDVLTPYSEGLACDNFDNNHYCNMYRNTSVFWFVLNKDVSYSSIIVDSESTIRFYGVIIFQID